MDQNGNSLPLPHTRAYSFTRGPAVKEVDELVRVSLVPGSCRRWLLILAAQDILWPAPGPLPFPQLTDMVLLIL